MRLTRDQNKVITTTRCARSVRKREGTRPGIRPMALGDRGTAWSRGRGLEVQGGLHLKSLQTGNPLHALLPARPGTPQVALVTAYVGAAPPPKSRDSSMFSNH